MLQDIRKNSQGTVAKIIVGLIVVVFSLFGVESIVGGLGGEPEVATVNGEDILQSDFLRAVEGKRRQIISQMGDKADPDLIDEGLLRSSVLEGMINEEILIQDSDTKGLYVSEMAIDNYIRSVEQFQVDGAFSNERMQVLLRNAGLTLQAYRDSLRSQFVSGQARSGLIASAFVLDDEEKEIIALDRQTRSFGVATVFKSDYVKSIEISDAEVSEYFERHQSEFKKPENVEVSYVELKRTDLEAQINVSDEDLLKLYESEKSVFQGEEQRAASHILVKISDDVNDEAALKKITDIQAKINAGDDFSELATEYSEDEGSAQNGGSLGLSAKGVYVAGFEDALFALSLGDVSAPIKTEFGYHLIKLDQIEANSMPSFDEMKEVLSSRLSKQKVDELFAESTEILADITYSSPDLAEVSEVLSLPVESLVGVSVNTDHPIFSNRKIQKVLFSDELVLEKHNSELIEVADSHAVVFRVESYQEESGLELSAVKDEIVDVLKVGKSADHAKTIGDTFIQRVEAGEAAETVAEDMSLNWKEHKDLRRDNVMLNREILTQVFTMPRAMIEKNAWQGYEVLGGDYVAVQLLGVNDGTDEKITAVEKSSISNMLSDTFGASDYQNYQKVALDSAEIERRNKEN